MSDVAANEPFYTRDAAGRYQPTPAGRGPWNPNSLHGRVVIGLLGHVIEDRHGAEGFLPARLTVDMYRLPDFSPVEVATRVLRDGARIKVVDAEFLSNGVSMARATCQLLRRTEAPEGQVWSPPRWEVPAPDAIESQAALGGMWAMKPISSGFALPGRRRAWIREVRAMVEGVPITPFARVAAMADIVSPFAHFSDHNGLGYINTDATLYLHRAPTSEWIGVEVTDHQASEGIATGTCCLYDETGPIGSASCTALAQRRAPR